jgi:oligopeptide/dipeptide ABC transporter ATP-binding protein
MRQRVMIAMALCLRPLLLIADEPTTALDVTVQAGILKLMKDLQEETGTAVLLITHDLGIVAEMADDVAVMYAGKIVESAPVARLYAEYRHPYTEGLLASLPGRAKRGEKLHAIAGTVPRAVLFPPGCRFHTRCPFAKEICREKEPPLVTAGERHLCACWVRAGDGNA